jgi:hypothetical protein
MPSNMPTERNKSFGMVLNRLLIVVMDVGVYYNTRPLAVVDIIMV